MKAPKLLLSVFACAAVVGSYAQNVPTHDSYVMPFDDGKSKPFSEYFREWEPGTPLSEDENFYIARVPMKERFVNTATQVDPTMTQDRKFCMWTPMGISDTYWQSLPRYVFDGDNFSMWSYVDSQGGWSLPWVRVPGAYSDVTHRNGVANSGGLVFFDSWGGDNTESNNSVNMLVEKDGGQFKWVEKFVKFLRYYGLDGVGINPEGTVPNASDLQDFFSQCREYAESIDWQFHVYWYGTNTNDGYMNLGSDFNKSKSDWLWKNGKQVVDMYMLNYSWSGYASQSVSVAEEIGANPYTLYAGYDIQGNWLGRGSWTTLKNTKMSIAFWGNHTTNMIYQNSSEFGSGDEAVQACYLEKQEQVFSGGYRNPAKRPAVANGITSSSEAAMERFHGIAEFLPARSVLQELPFVTRFCLGNGKSFYEKGEVTFPNKWFNVGVQDYLPTWRWWITDDNKNVPEDGIEGGFTFDDAWYGGSALKFNGATTVSNVRLFKTNFNVSEDDAVSMTIKLKNGTYTLRAYYGEQTTASRDVFYVEGTKPFVVDADQQQVTVDCYPKCAQVVAAFSADMAEFFTDYSVVYETEALKAEGATAVWSKTDADPWFLKVNEKGENVKATITVTRKSDNKSATVVREYSMAPGKLWTLNISPNQNDGSLGIVIEVDETTNDQEIDIVVPSDWI